MIEQANDLNIDNDTLDQESDTGTITRQESSVEDIMFAKMHLLDEIRHRLFDRFFKYVCPLVCFVAHLII